MKEQTKVQKVYFLWFLSKISISAIEWNLPCSMIQRYLEAALYVSDMTMYIQSIIQVQTMQCDAMSFTPWDYSIYPFHILAS